MSIDSFRLVSLRCGEGPADAAAMIPVTNDGFVLKTERRLRS
jgi:hypothetical protein